MKNSVLIIISFFFLACSNDDFFRDDLKPQHSEQQPETPPEGLKLKYLYAINSSSYYYHKNSFIDSIFTSNSWLGYVKTRKYIYNDKNQIIARRFREYDPNHMEFETIESTYYKYNTKSQIVEAITYDKDSIVVGFRQYKYANDGYLLNSGVIIVNGNVVKSGSTTYQFDNNPNPFYNIYPNAYRILNYVNKNNILVTEERYGNNVYTYLHTLEYNSQNYIISEHISNMPIDSEDSRGFSYY
ncbi:hypothetical protein P3875_08205 [Myroides sp. JBRI-B21084]|uniref:hypothetical protein n=1 Tax=Myroides sp. JBRI-B21084 TaxID=3119977 RepID=UPI0026E14010|nr:hypothetical protein [Paenimyroides cloacae]WKW45768.1 hypothetical protein P3875_08205 [Paenimyroides cloacae]